MSEKVPEKSRKIYQKTGKHPTIAYVRMSIMLRTRQLLRRDLAQLSHRRCASSGDDETRLVGALVCTTLPFASSLSLCPTHTAHSHPQLKSLIPDTSKNGRRNASVPIPSTSCTPPPALTSILSTSRAASSSRRRLPRTSPRLSNPTSSLTSSSPSSGLTKRGSSRSTPSSHPAEKSPTTSAQPVSQ